jgi:hypothetical protein
LKILVSGAASFWNRLFVKTPKSNEIETGSYQLGTLMTNGKTE